MLLTEPLGQTKAAETRTVVYNDILIQWHRRLLDLGYHREFRLEGQPLDGLRLLITPAMLAVDAEFLAKVRAWVEAGGTWIVAPLTGTRTPEHTAQLGAGLGEIERLAGIESVFGFPITLTGATGRAFGTESELTGWCMALKPHDGDTTVLGTISGGPADGLAFITERRVGHGRVIVVGAEPFSADRAAPSVLDRVVRHAATAAGLQPLAEKPRDLLLVPRRTLDGRRQLVALNLAAHPASFTLPQPGTDALTGARVDIGPLDLAGYSYRVITFE